jgi:hypothetical protein
MNLELRSFRFAMTAQGEAVCLHIKGSVSQPRGPAQEVELKLWFSGAGIQTLRKMLQFNIWRLMP